MTCSLRAPRATSTTGAAASVARSQPPTAFACSTAKLDEWIKATGFNGADRRTFDDGFRPDDGPPFDEREPPPDDGPASDEQEPPPAAAPCVRRPLDWKRLADLEPPDRDWAIEGWLGMGHVTLLAGLGGIGKTLLAQAVGSALARGRQYIDTVPQPRRVLMWAAEDDEGHVWIERCGTHSQDRGIAAATGGPTGRLADRGPRLAQGHERKVGVPCCRCVMTGHLLLEAIMETTCTLQTAARTIDWEAIRLAFETSNASTRAIARLHSIPHAAISKRARAGGWKRPDGSPPGGVKSAVRRVKAKAGSKGGGLAAIDDHPMLEVLADVAGGTSVNMALKRVGVSPGTFYRTLASGPQWLEKYQRARASCMDAVADSLIELADEKPPLVMSGETGDPRVDPGWVSWQKNRIYARQWVHGRLAPQISTCKRVSSSPSGSCRARSRWAACRCTFVIAMFAP